MATKGPCPEGRRPLDRAGSHRRATRWDGSFPIDLADPDQLAECAGEIRALRGDLDGFDLTVE